MPPLNKSEIDGIISCQFITAQSFDRGQNLTGREANFLSKY
jgi:hypothetical protein